MPTIKLPDGTNLFVQSSNPEDIEIAKQRFQKRKASGGSSGSLIGDIGRGIGAGVVSIPQGIATLPTTGIDLLFDTNVTEDVNAFFEEFKPEVDSTAGKTAQLITQFGLPGLRAASALSKLSKGKQLAGVAAVDAAVATDDVETFADMIFDDESDEERLQKLEGRDAATERLKERLQVFGETAAFVYATPKIVGGAVKTAGAGLDLAAPYLSALAKATIKDGSEGVAAAARADRNVGDFLRKNFTYGGAFEQTAKNNKVIADAMQAKMLYASTLEREVIDNMEKIRKTMEDASTIGGKLTDKDALELTKAISAYRTPLLVVERQYPNLKSGAKKKAIMKRIREDALKKIKSFEGSGNKIDYESLGVNTNNHISKLLEENNGLFRQEQQMILELSDPKAAVTSLLIKPPFRKAIEDNIGYYGTTIYRSILEKGYEVPKQLKDKAVKQIKEAFKTDDNTARDIFSKLIKGSQGGQKYETPEMFVENIKFGLLQGKDLKNLPAVREAMGEVTPLSYKNPGDWRKALKDEATATAATMSKLGSLVGSSKTFATIRQLNDDAIRLGSTPFLKTANDFGGQLPREAKIIDPKTGKPETYKSGPLKGQEKPAPVKETFYLDDANGNPVEYVKFGKQSGALMDTYAPRVFFDAVTGAQKDFISVMPVPIKKLYQGLLGLKSFAQYGKTILGPTAQIRNNTSVPFMALMNANLGPSGNFMNNFKMAFAGAIDPRQKTKFTKEVKEASEYGLMVGRGTQLQEIADVATFATDDSSLLLKLKSTGVGDTINRIKGVPEKIYTGSDNAARLINWSGEQSKLTKVIAKSSDDSMMPVTSARNMTDSDIAKLITVDKDMGAVVNVGQLKRAGDKVLDKFIKGEAADIALNVTPTYSRVPRVVKELKYLPVIGNFTAFPAEIIRNTYNTLSRAIKELASNNTELQKIGARRIAGGLTATVGVPSALTATALALTGAEQEQVDAYKRSFAAPWEKTATMIPTGTDSKGNITGFYNFSYTNPYDFLQRPFKAISNAIANGNTNEASLMSIASNAAFDSVGEFVDPFLSGSIGAAALQEAYQGKTATGKVIWNESDMLGEKSYKGMLHALNAVAPTATPFRIEVDAEGTQIVPKDFTTAAASLFTGEDATISPRGKEIDVAETLVSAFSGIKIAKPQIQRSLYYKAAESKRAIRETTNEFNRLLRSNNRRDAEDFVKGYINTNESRYNSLRTLYTAIEDARTLGLADYEIDEQLKIAKVANRDLVMLGIFKPSEINPDVLQFAIQGTKTKSPQPVPVGELAVTGADLTGQSLRGQFIPPQTRASSVLRQEEIDKLFGGT